MCCFFFPMCLLIVMYLLICVCMCAQWISCVHTLSPKPSNIKRQNPQVFRNNTQDDIPEQNAKLSTSLWLQGPDFVPACRSMARASEPRAKPGRVRVSWSPLSSLLKFQNGAWLKLASRQAQGKPSEQVYLWRQEHVTHLGR